MRRRELALGLVSLAGVAWIRVSAQQLTKLPKLAILSPEAPSNAEEPGGTLYNMLTGLAKLGYVDGENISLEFRSASHALKRLPALAAELVAEQPDVLYTWTSGGARAAAAATSTIPIVVAPVNEATMAALVADFAHPADNVTGMTLNNKQQHEKCLQLLKEAAPSITRVGVLLNPLNPVWQTYPDVLDPAARALGFTLVRIEARGEAELDQAFAAMVAGRVEGLFGLSDSTLVGNMQTLKRIVKLVSEYRLPSVSDETDFARVGGLLSLGPDFLPIGRGAAEYIHRILQGAKVAELPVVHPPKFLLIVNLKAAEALGLTIPPSVLLGADEVIE
jgi:putative tryptophan/tyrosine transport system substrate-binding protein